MATWFVYSALACLPVILTPRVLPPRAVTVLPQAGSPGPGFQAAQDGLVHLTIVSKAKGQILVALLNDTPHQIYVFYDPGDNRKGIVPVVYELQRRRIGEASFHRIGTPSDLVLDILAPIAPGDKVLFEVNTAGKDPGRYRVRASYIADESIYQLYKNKWPNLEDEEFMRMLAAGNNIYTPVFRIVRTRR